MRQENITLQLSQTEYTQLLAALKNLPYKQVEHLIHKLEAQGNQTLSPELQSTLNKHEVVLERVQQIYKVGDKVRAKWQQGSTWYNGTITAFEKGRYHIKYDDGDKEWTTATYIEALHHPGEPNAQETFQLGDRVQARWKGNDVWFNGTIEKIEGQKYFIKYDDGDEEWTTAEFIIKK